MKKTYLFSAIIALAVTVATISLSSVLQKDNGKTIRIEHVDSLPGAKAMYTVNGDGDVVPLDFTKVAEEVMGAVVHIKSTQTHSSNNNYQQMPGPFEDLFKNDPFRDFFFRREAPQRRDRPPIEDRSG